METITNSQIRKNLASLRDHLLYAHHNPKFVPFMHKVETLRELQKVSKPTQGCVITQQLTGFSPGICHQVAREEFIEVSDFIQATDSHTCMGGASNALTWGLEQLSMPTSFLQDFTFVKVPESIRFELSGSLNEGCTAKDVILHILADQLEKS